MVLRRVAPAAVWALPPTGLLYEDVPHEATQLRFLDLAKGCARECVDEQHMLGVLILGEATNEQRSNFPFAQAPQLARFDARNQGFAGVWIGTADDGGFGKSRDSRREPSRGRRGTRSMIRRSRCS